ncbi:MAG: hypothetical protein HOB26_10850 [Flavobacteriales bacterium]|nr:hypothetical protein [Flavobacteriales bacterium]
MAVKLANRSLPTEAKKSKLLLYFNDSFNGLMTMGTISTNLDCYTVIAKV